MLPRRFTPSHSMSDCPQTSAKPTSSNRLSTNGSSRGEIEIELAGKIALRLVFDVARIPVSLGRLRFA